MIISRATKLLSRPGLIMRRTQSKSQLQDLVIVQKRFKQTGKSADPRCEEKPKKSRKMVSVASIAVAGTTIAVIAARYDEDFRNWTREHLPALDNMVKVIYEEEETHLDFLARAHKELTEWLKRVLYDAFTGVKESGDSKKGRTALPEVCEESKKPYKPPASAFLEKKHDDDKKEVQNDGFVTKSSSGVPRHIKELKEMEDEMVRTAQDTIQAYHAVVCALREQANLIDNLDQLISKHDCKVWDKLHKKMDDEKQHFEKAEVSSNSAESTANKLKSHLDDDAELTVEIKDRARNNLIIVMNDVRKAKENVDKEKAKLSLAKRAWDKVRQARMHFSEELETLFPNVWLNDEKLNLPVDSLDPFIQNVLNNILFLDKELSKLQTVRDAEVSSAIERFRSTSDTEGLIAAAVNMEVSKEKRLGQEEMQKSLLTHQAKCEKNARTLMKQQAEVYSDLKAEAISMKEREVERRMQQQLEERLAEVRAEHKMEIAKMVGRIQGANEAIAQRGDKDKDQQERQQFWSAAQSLLAAVKPIGLTVQQEPKPLKNEITNVTNTAPEGDELVENIVKSIPQLAIDRGVQNEIALKNRFLNLETEARKVASVPEGEVSLLQLFIAQLQSALYLDEPIPQEELDNEPIDMAQLNNYEVLHRARYYVDHGDLDQAIKYLNLLKGPACKVASDWVRDVVAYLETRQAAELLLAHASASSLQD